MANDNSGSTDSGALSFADQMAMANETAKSLTKKSRRKSVSSLNLSGLLGGVTGSKSHNTNKRPPKINQPNWLTPQAPEIDHFSDSQTQSQSQSFADDSENGETAIHNNHEREPKIEEEAEDRQEVEQRELNGNAQFYLNSDKKQEQMDRLANVMDENPNIPTETMSFLIDGLLPSQETMDDYGLSNTSMPRDADDPIYNIVTKGFEGCAKSSDQITCAISAMNKRVSAMEERLNYRLNGIEALIQSVLLQIETLSKTQKEKSEVENTTFLQVVHTLQTTAAGLHASTELNKQIIEGLRFANTRRPIGLTNGNTAATSTVYPYDTRARKGSMGMTADAASAKDAQIKSIEIKKTTLDLTHTVMKGGKR